MKNKLFTLYSVVLYVLTMLAMAQNIEPLRPEAALHPQAHGQNQAVQGETGETQAAQGGAEDAQAAQQEAESAQAVQTESETEEQPAEITLSLVGDCTLGTDENFAWDTSLNAYYAVHGGAYFLKNVREVFEQDDLTVINMEGTLTQEMYREDKTFAFKGDPEFVSILTTSSVEAANLANNHSFDYGEQSYYDTKNTLEENGVRTFGYDRTAIFDVKNVRVGFLGIYELDDHLGRSQQVIDNIHSLKQEGADIIVAVFHWGIERMETPDENQIALAHLAIDEGADLVVGHHPHVLQGIEEYKGKTIAYSLGNFCFGGNTNPSDMDTVIFQKKFTVDSKKEIADSETNLIPCSVSSDPYINNYQPTILGGSDAERVLEKIRQRL